MVNTRFRSFVLLLTALWLLYALPSQAALQAQVDRNPVAMNEPFTLTLKSDAGGGDPDLTALKRDFAVLGQSKSNSLQIINGSISRSTQWQISLAAKQSGPVQIPAIPIGSASSPPISLTVTPQSQASVDQQNRNLFLEVSATPQTVHVQQQIVFTVRLYSALNLGNGSQLSDPEFPGMDALVKPLGDAPPFEVQRNGQTYTVVERRYAVFPQKSGQFSSTPVVFDGSVIEANQGGNGPFMFNPFNQTSRPMRLRSKPLAFDVKPVPPGIDSNAWLPASSVQLSEQWSSNPPVFSVGEPITRTLTLMVAGLTASQLPTLNSGAIDGLKVYPDQPTLKDAPGDSGMRATRTEKIAYIPTRTGSVTLPAISIKWWNVAANKMELAQLPARTVTVLPGSASAAVPPVVAGSAGAPVAAAPAPSVPPPAQPDGMATRPAAWWPWLALLFGVGWLVTLLAWLWRRKATVLQSAPVSPKTARLGQLEQAIQRACQANDAALAKTQLLAWAKARWPTQPSTSLTAMARRCEPALAEALITLDRSLYAAAQSDWRGEDLWQQFSRHTPAADQAEAQKPAPLAPLYKSTEK
jgi:hypothetical protein